MALVLSGGRLVVAVQAFACQEVVDLAPAASEETSTLMGGITSMPVVWWRSLVGGINRKISRE